MELVKRKLLRSFLLMDAVQLSASAADSAPVDIVQFKLTLSTATVSHLGGGGIHRKEAS